MTAQEHPKLASFMDPALISSIIAAAMKAAQWIYEVIMEYVKSRQEAKQAAAAQAV